MVKHLYSHVRDLTMEAMGHINGGFGVWSES